MKLPSETQIENAGFMGWQYLGEGLFARGNELGWFTDQGFVRE